jgi:hypothetical protein
MRSFNKWIALTIVLSALMVTPAMVFAIIDDATVNYNTGSITVVGTGFGVANGTVLIDSTSLTVSSWSANTIVAVLPANIAPGSYLLSVTKHNGAVETFDVTIGTAGAFSSWFTANLYTVGCSGYSSCLCLSSTSGVFDIAISGGASCISVNSPGSSTPPVNGTLVNSQPNYPCKYGCQPNGWQASCDTANGIAAADIWVTCLATATKGVASTP